MIEKIKKRHVETFGGEPIFVIAPSRVNLIGEHTDYNLGYALPAAVDKSMCFAIAPNEDKVVRLIAYDLDEQAEFDLSDATFPKGHWTGFFKCALAILKERGMDFSGIDCTFGGNVPIGAGMSSSTAITCGFIFSLDHIYGWGMEKKEMILLGSASEHRFGVKGGLLDQHGIIHGKKDEALLLDFLKMSFENIPVRTGDYRFVLFNTCVKHALVDSPYNKRRESCERALEAIQNAMPQVKSYQDIDEGTLNQFADSIAQDDFVKARYVIRENERVLAAAEALKSCDLTRFGELLWQSHNGLRNEYDVSCEELDFMVDYIRDEAGVLGSRMMGGGFGGCVINLIHKDRIDEIWAALKKAYMEKFPQLTPEMYPVAIEDGIRVL